jgi:hypothetical protein
MTSPGTRAWNWNNGTVDFPTISDVVDTEFNQNWSAYYAAIICGLIFGSMQSVQDSLDNPFDGISEDDIDL